ncbi:MAG: HD domain-containing protein [Kosmotogaceae bacterium]|nr:HD domain-containing protein [Kosmotogaceae bacterium]
MQNYLGRDEMSSSVRIEKMGDLNVSQMELILQNVAESVLLLDSDLRILWANNSALQRINKSVDYALGKLRCEVMSCKLPHAECPVEEAMTSMKSCSREVVVNGVQWSIRAYPIIDKLGELAGVMEVSEDITGRAEKDRELRALVESVSDGIWRWNVNTGEVEWSNRAFEMLGYVPNELRMSLEQWKSMLHPDDRESCLRKELAGINGSEAGFSIEFRLKAKNGGWRWILSRGKVIRRASDGSPMIVVGTHFDTDERKEHEIALKRSRDDLIMLMSRSVEMKDPYTHDHQRRVSLLSKKIAVSIGLSEKQIETVEIAALLHDIGKLFVPGEILVKTGNLSSLELGLIRSHAESGYEILKDVEFDKPIAQIILQHHERLDGSGYPKGIKDGDIFLEAKIIAVADVVEAMSSHRPYRAALGLEAALEEIRSNSGKLYEPEVVNHCLKVIEEGFIF